MSCIKYLKLNYPITTCILLISVCFNVKFCCLTSITGNGTYLISLQTFCSSLMKFLLPRVGVFHPPTPELLSRDPHVRDHASKDPLNYRGRLTARTLAELALGGRDLRRQMAKIDIPTLILHGTADRIAKSGDSEKLYESVSCRDKTYLTYHGYFHEILNDYGKEVVLEDICSWLHQRAPVF